MLFNIIYEYESLISHTHHFSTDTSFMYVISVLSMLKIYQTRHPDINASASATYAALAVAILLGVIGVLSGTLLFWILFGLIHVVACLLLSCQIYYMGRWKFGKIFYVFLIHYSNLKKKLFKQL